MPSPMDSAMRSRNWVLAFGGVVAAASVWSIWGSDVFPRAPDPEGDPENWAKEEMWRWLENRNLFPNPRDSREQLLERIKANLRTPRR